MPPYDGMLVSRSGSVGDDRVKGKFLNLRRSASVAEGVRKFFVSTERNCKRSTSLGTAGPSLSQ